MCTTVQYYVVMLVLCVVLANINLSSKCRVFFTTSVQLAIYSSVSANLWNNFVQQNNVLLFAILTCHQTRSLHWRVTKPDRLTSSSHSSACFRTRFTQRETLRRSVTRSTVSFPLSLHSASFSQNRSVLLFYNRITYYAVVCLWCEENIFYVKEQCKTNADWNRPTSIFCIHF